jgi:hypothetical protein
VLLSNNAVRSIVPFTHAYTYSRYLVTFWNEFLPGFGESRSANMPVLQHCWLSVVSVKHVDSVADPSAFARAAANTEYELVSQLSPFGHGSGRLEPRVRAVRAVVVEHVERTLSQVDLALPFQEQQDHVATRTGRRLAVVAV